MIATIKRNWAVILLSIIGLSWAKNYFFGYSYGNSLSSTLPMSGGGQIEMANTYSKGIAMPSFDRQVAPSASTSRVVIQNTSLSLHVKDVQTEIKRIQSITEGFGGFLVNSYLSVPDSAASGNISIRIPEEKRSLALESFKKLAVKVVSESVSGNDVTDQYTDLQAQLDILISTKAKYQDIMNRATAVSDLLSVQQQLTSLQQQIDSVKGQQQYFEKSAKLSLVSVYLSTDELALPYAPTNEWRPAVIFKEAIRSLVGSFRGVGSLLIWGFVYLPILLPITALIWFYKKRQSRVK